ncbi:Gfo/Idh/MocA family protein [Streptomyces sp. NPDC050560]|uniref:Gfo/Idh/MocA family protein n=1 Tax=Streptomyces sp. NPDC050560 TaxID=3365630 RepID=UPI0037AB09C8
MRIGIIGTENSHGDHIIDHLNVRQAAGDARIVALSGGHSPRNEALARTGHIDLIVDEPADLLRSVDAVIITDRHGGLHRAHALPFLTAGLPVFVDKPLACTVTDAQAIVDAAVAHDAPLTSSSALRWVADTDALATALEGPPRAVVTSGPADPASEHGGIFFYGIHPVDVALRLAPGPVSAVHTHTTDTTVTAVFTAGPTRVVVNLVRPEGARQIPFHGTVVTQDAVAARELTLDAHYCVPGLEAFLTMARTHEPPIAYTDLLRPVQVLESIAGAL